MEHDQWLLPVFERCLERTMKVSRVRSEELLLPVAGVHPPRASNETPLLCRTGCILGERVVVPLSV